MALYLKKVKLELRNFSAYDIQQIPRTENSNADALARLASSKDSELLRVVPVEVLEKPTIEETENPEVMVLDPRSTWMTPILMYLLNGELPEDKGDARRLRYRAARYVVHDDILYRRGYSAPLLRCLDEEQSVEVLREIHEGVCGNHTGGHSLAQKVLRQGYYWPDLKKDAFEYARKCDRCQRYANVPRAPPEDLTTILSPWPFAKWGVDIIGPFHRTLEGYKFAIVAVDYFTKWAEAEPMTTITEHKCTKFLWSNIVCRFGVPHSIVSDNGKQFDNANVRDFCEGLGIHKNFSSVAHPQANGQVEAVNKIIKVTLKRSLDKCKGKWADQLQKVLWAYRTTARTSTAQTPFSLTYGTEAVLPVELGIPSARVQAYDEAENSGRMNEELDLLEERRTESQLRLAAYQNRASRYYNKRVRQRSFSVGGLVLRLVMQNTKSRNSGALGPNWEGPYRVLEVIRPGTYRLEGLGGEVIKHTWNAEHLKKYYQ